MEPFVTAAEFSAWTNGVVPENDPRVLPLLAGASAAIRRFCGWHVAPQINETVTLDGEGGRVLSLRTKHLAVVHSVTARGVAYGADSYGWSEIGNIELYSGCFPHRYRSIAVEMEHGYDLADVEDVKQIVKQVCAAAISSPMGATREQAGAVSVQWATTAPNVAGGLSLLQRDLDVLSRFRLIPGV